MAQVWVALLRAVNLGSRNKVPMARLRPVFEDAGCAAVRTHLQSGNVLFEHPSPDAAAFEAAVMRTFGVETVVVLRTARQVRSLVSSHPFGRDASRTYVAFPAARLRRPQLAHRHAPG